jgi:hypothetical protein
MIRIEKPQAEHRAPPAQDGPPRVAEHEQAVLKAIRDTSYGTIEVTIHQSKIVQITRSEKLRL